MVPTSTNVALSTGTAMHRGLDYLFTNLKDAKKPLIILTELTGDAVKAATGELSQLSDYALEKGESEGFQSYTRAEQRSLIEGLLWCFAYQMVPDWLERYEIMAVEREEAQTLSSSLQLVLEGRVDLILREKAEPTHIYVVSFKTTASLDDRMIDSYGDDIQGVSESWLVEQRLGQENSRVNHYRELLAASASALVTADFVQEAENTLAIVRAMTDKLMPEKVTGVIMVDFIKGRRYERVKGSGKWETINPLIKGYRKLVGADLDYAHSWYYSNPANKSGKSILGKGWEPIDVWEEYEGGVKGWIGAIARGEIQPEEKILAEQIWTQTYFRNDRQMESWRKQHEAMESETSSRVLALRKGNGLDELFMQNRKACHYPRRCEYLDICNNPEIENDPIGSGIYQWREPHHEREKASLVQIQKD